MQSLRPCGSENIFTQATSYDCKCTSFAQAAGSFASLTDDWDDYSDPDMTDSDTEEFDIDSPPIIPTFEVPSRGDPQDALVYGDLMAQILQSEEPRDMIQPGVIEALNGTKIREHRLLLGEWLVNLSFAYPTTTESLFQAVSLFDRYLSKRIVPFNKLQLMCCCCMWICVKIELNAEESLNPLFECCHNKYTRTDFIRAESEILCAVDYRLQNTTPFFFMKRFLTAIEADERISLIAGFLCECTLLFVEMSYYRASAIGFCAVAAACLIFDCGDKLATLGTFAGNFVWNDISRCLAHMLYAGKQITAREKDGVYRKYAAKEIGGVAGGGGRLIKSVDFGAGLIRHLATFFGV